MSVDFIDKFIRNKNKRGFVTWYFLYVKIFFMAPLRTYGNSRKKKLSQSENALNSLLTINLRKRLGTSSDVSGSTKENTVDNTFDRLLKGDCYNTVQYRGVTVNITGSSYESFNALPANNAEVVFGGDNSSATKELFTISSSPKRFPIVFLERKDLSPEKIKTRKHVEVLNDSTSGLNINDENPLDSSKGFDQFPEIPDRYLKQVRFDDKARLMTSLELKKIEPFELYSNLQNSIRRKSTSQAYFLRNRRRKSSNKQNDQKLDSPSTSLFNESYPHHTPSQGILDDSALPIITSTPIHHRKSNLRDEKAEDKYGSIVKTDSKFLRKSQVVLEHLSDLEDMINFACTKSSSPVQIESIQVNNNFVTKRQNRKSRTKTKMKRLLEESLSENPKKRLTTSQSKQNNASTKSDHICSMNCEHFRKQPIVVLTRNNFSISVPVNKPLEPVIKPNSHTSSPDSSLVEFKGFKKSFNSKRSVTDKDGGKSDASSKNKDNFKCKKVSVILEHNSNPSLFEEKKLIKNDKKLSECYVNLCNSKSDCELNISGEKSVLEGFQEPKTLEFMNLEPGKKFRRSIAIFRRKTLLEQLNKGEALRRMTTLKRRTIKLIPILQEESELTELGSFALNNSGYVSPLQSDRRSSLEKIESYLPISSVNEFITCHTKVNVDEVSARDIVLKKCGQRAPINFSECYPSSALQHCQKLGEGVFGEVFLKREKDGSLTVMKVIPIEGEQIVNLEKQKTFGEILSEIIISSVLSNLRKGKRNFTDAFVELKSVRCVEGCYPKCLLELWELYDENKQSENDSPEMFLSDQLYIVLELANAGQDLEAYQFTNAQQALAVFEQVACTLAVAETELKFEHRDLHWGNVLIRSSSDETSIFVLDGEEINVKNKGVKATVIDFTLSRVEHEGVIIFNDLSMDPDLFTAKGDYQFEVYRKMKQHNGNRWQSFQPYTNILWLHYLLGKAIDGFRYKSTKSKVHKSSMAILRAYEDQILDFNSASEFVMKNFTKNVID